MTLFHENGKPVKYRSNGWQNLGIDNEYTNVGHEIVVKNGRKYHGKLDIENIAETALINKMERLYFSLSIKTYVNGVIDVYYCDQVVGNRRSKVLILENLEPEFGPIVFPSSKY